VEHLPDLGQLFLTDRELQSGDNFGVGGELEVILGLRRRRQRDVKELREVLVGRTTGSLSDVRRGSKASTA